MFRFAYDDTTWHRSTTFEKWVCTRMTHRRSLTVFAHTEKCSLLWWVFVCESDVCGIHLAISKNWTISVNCVCATTTLGDRACRLSHVHTQRATQHSTYTQCKGKVNGSVKCDLLRYAIIDKIGVVIFAAPIVAVTCARPHESLYRKLNKLRPMPLINHQMDYTSRRPL